LKNQGERIATSTMRDCNLQVPLLTANEATKTEDTQKQKHR
jgi:hypothetical protein